MPVNHLELWRAIGRLEATRELTDGRLERIEGDVAEVRGQVGDLRRWAQRGSLLVLLWVAAISINLSSEQKAEAISSILSALTKR